MDYILQQVVTHAAHERANDAAFAAHYQFVRWKQEDELDSQRRVTKSSRKISTNSPSTTLTAESAATNLLSAAQGDDVKVKGVGKRDLAINGDLLSRFSFTLNGRDEMDGRSRLALDFAPSAAAPSARNLAERFLQHVAGRVWVDERSWRVIKLELHLLESFNVVGGLAGSVKDLRYAFERAVTPEGWWYTQSLDWELVGRAVVSRKHVVVHEGRTNLVRLR